jgi:hypothetical protein
MVQRGPFGSCQHDEVDRAGRLPGRHRWAAATGAALEGPTEMLDGLTRYLSKQPGELTGRR